jgi:hypothetical protein
MEELEAEVSNALNEINREVDGGEDSFVKFVLTDILSRLNVGRSKNEKISRQELENVLTTLEEQNKVMFIRDGDDPCVMII